MIKVAHFRQHILSPALRAIDMYSPEAEQILLGTSCAESKLGTDLVQKGGPALGVFQMEPFTHFDIWETYLKYRADLANKIRSLLPESAWNVGAIAPKPEYLIHDLRYAAIMARLKYRRSPLALPEVGDWEGCATVWKSVYNSSEGRGTEHHFMESLSYCGVV